MPKRVIDFDAVWASDKLANCAPWARAEYTWIYGLADSNGSFELTNLRVIFGRAYAIRDDVTIQHLSRALEEFRGKEGAAVRLGRERQEVRSLDGQRCSRAPAAAIVARASRASGAAGAAGGAG